MACRKCEQLIFNFTEELGEYVSLHLAFVQQLEIEPKDDDLTDTGYQLMTARMAQGAVVAELVKKLASAACDGHDDRGEFEQYDLFGNRTPMNS
jgi:hypothetical protein